MSVHTWNLSYQFDGMTIKSSFFLRVCRLDIGEGKDLDLPECPRALLKQQCIRYLGPVRYVPPTAAYLYLESVTYKLAENFCGEQYAGLTHTSSTNIMPVSQSFRLLILSLSFFKKIALPFTIKHFH
jgi:hypothetical protein